MTQILRGQQSTLTLTAYSDGSQEDQGTFTIGIVDLAGNEIAAPGTAVTDNGDGTYSYTLAAQDHVNMLVATWTAADVEYVTYAEIVGNFLFTEHQARTFQDGRLETEAKFSDAEIAAERVRITDWLESVTGASWVPRYRRLHLAGNGTDYLPLYDVRRSEGASGGEGATFHINRILQAQVDGETVTTEIDGIGLWVDTGHFPRSRRPNVVLDVEYGYQNLRSGVDRIALLELVTRLPASRLSQTAVSATDEFGSYSWEPQNNGRPSRLPEVNAWLRANDARVPIA